MKAEKITKRIVKKKVTTKVSVKKHTPRFVAIKKIIPKKLETRHVSARNRKVVIRKVINIVPKKKENVIPFFTFATMRNVAAILVFTLISVNVLNVGVTDAYYNDVETSKDNLYQAGSIDFTLTQTPYPLPETVINMQSGATASSTINVIPEASSNTFWYHASSTNFGIDIDYCETLKVKTTLEGLENYSGLLKDFLSPATTTLSNWQMDIFTDSNSYNKICTFDFEYSAWQERHNLPEFDEMGFNDVEKVGNKVASWGFRINKVYYDVKTPERGIENSNDSNEWVEIYNQTDTALDINGWQICDNNSCDTLANTSPIMIPAKGFGVITATSTTWKYWELANNVVPIVINNEIGNGLSNSGDRLILKRPDGQVMDEMNWQNDTGVWNPGVVDVAEGHTLARKPNGYDTNSPSDFVDLAPPVLNLIYPDQSGSLTWYWTHNYNILWSALNLNGPDSDLMIDLSYIKDVDHTSTITSTDETISIGKNLSNTGSYTWQVPSGFLGYIWLKIVATGPENPMLNTKMTSGKIYDPFPMEILLIDPMDVNNIPPEPIVEINTEDPNTSVPENTDTEVSQNTEENFESNTTENSEEATDNPSNEEWIEIKPVDASLAEETPIEEPVVVEEPTVTVEQEEVVEPTVPVVEEQVVVEPIVVPPAEPEPIIIPEPEQVTLPEPTIQ